MPGQFSIVKSVDSASPQIVNAVASGALFPSGSALLYNSNPAGPPNATLGFQNVIASSHQLQGGGTLEQDGFVANNPISMFLELPGSYRRKLDAWPCPRRANRLILVNSQPILGREGGRLSLSRHCFRHYEWNSVPDCFGPVF